MDVKISFYSYFKDLAGCAQTIESVPPGSSIKELLAQLFVRLPKMAQMQNSMLIAVGFEYQKPDYVLKEGDEVSLFPPVQGG